MFSYFTAPSSYRAGDKWFSVGLASSFPDLGQDEEEVGVLSQPRPTPCGGNDNRPGCKAFHVPRLDSLQSKEVPILAFEEEEDVQEEQSSDVGDETVPEATKLGEQGLVFRYMGKFHAVDHVS